MYPCLENVCPTVKWDVDILVVLLVSKSISALKGAQWLSGRVLDSRPRGCGLEPHRRHCVV